MANQLDKLLAQQERATQKKHEAEQQEKRLKKQISDLKNKERTHRLCTRGAFLEKLLQKPELFSAEDVFALLEYVFSTPYAKDRLKAMLAAKQHGSDNGNPIDAGEKTATGIT